MSCLENDKIWDDIMDIVDLDNLSDEEYESFMNMDLEDSFDFAMNYAERGHKVLVGNK